MYIHKGRVAASDPERVSALTDSLSMPRIKPLLADLQMTHKCMQ